jgi:hypothetical protein
LNVEFIVVAFSFRRAGSGMGEIENSLDLAIQDRGGEVAARVEAGILP